MKMYFEFDKQDYYGLITVESDPNGFYIDDTASVYVETVGGENVDEVLEEDNQEPFTYLKPPRNEAVYLFLLNDMKSNFLEIIINT